MCIIVDINVLHKMFPAPLADYLPIYRAILKKKARMAYGGGLLREYQRVPNFHRLLLRLDQQGSARQVSDSAVDAEAEKLRIKGECVSNDHHVIALARVGNVRLLCSEDQKLATDFKNAALINKPRGSVYKCAGHAGLIKKHCAQC